MWVSGLIVPDSAPGRILEAIRDGQVVPVISWELADELLDVLSRKRMRRYRIGPDDLDDVMFVIAPSLPTVEMDVAVRDPDDAPLVAAAVAGRADAIVTGDGDLWDDAELCDWLRRRSVEVLRPAALAERL